MELIAIANRVTRRRLDRARGFACHLEYSKGEYTVETGILGSARSDWLSGPQTVKLGSWRDLNPPSRRRQWGPNRDLKPGCAVEKVYNCLGFIPPMDFCHGLAERYM